MADKGSRRKSKQIGRKPAANLHHATKFAPRLGRPLNEFATINYSHTGCSPDEASERFRKMVKERFARWLKRKERSGRTIPPTYVWAFENAGGQTAVHWLVHIPRDLRAEFRALLPRWIAKSAGPDTTGKAIRCKPIRNIVGLKRYLLKGMDSHFAEQWNIRHVPQGEIIGKRTGFSRSLGPAARGRSGYQAKRRTAAGNYYTPRPKTDVENVSASRSSPVITPISAPPVFEQRFQPTPKADVNSRLGTPANDPSPCCFYNHELDNFLAQAQIYPGFPTAAEQIAKTTMRPSFLVAVMGDSPQRQAP